MAVRFRNHPPAQIVSLDGMGKRVGNRHDTHERTLVFYGKPAGHRSRTPDGRLNRSLAHERVVESRLLKHGSHAHFPHERGIEIALRLDAEIFLQDFAVGIQLQGLRLFGE